MDEKPSSQRTVREIKIIENHDKIITMVTFYDGYKTTFSGDTGESNLMNFVTSLSELMALFPQLTSSSKGSVIVYEVNSLLPPRFEAEDPVASVKLIAKSFSSPYEFAEEEMDWSPRSLFVVSENGRVARWA